MQMHEIQDVHDFLLPTTVLTMTANLRNTQVTGFAVRRSEGIMVKTRMKPKDRVDNQTGVTGEVGVTV